MKQSIHESMKVAEEMVVLARLAAFDDVEITHSLEFEGMSTEEALRIALADANKLLRVAGIQIEQENFIHLEYAIHKLRTMFLTIGCFRLSYLLERMYRNLTKVRIDYLRIMLSIARKEFQLAKNEISRYLEISTDQLETA